MDKKRLEIALSRLKTFSSGKAELEQYQMPSSLGAEIVWWAYMNGDVNRKIVCELGCGNGILGVGAGLLGASAVYFVDVDSSMIKLAKENAKGLKVKAGFFNCDVSDFDKKCDTVVMNPPFGVQREHSDREFLLKAFESCDAVYSVHKSESKGFIQKICADNKFFAAGVLDRNFVIRKFYDFHTKMRKDVRVKAFCLRRR